ncbi:LAQU0S01e01684g1_1 [Lachancea quebecensis]|uniref:LAQU0S01e01684g1_1 n=1 Tax=Lachancea quebecensis TaxID=1654605 RepID=A0A0P1KLF0_9SACH|nr:LAQU0S01e01684g1_1 [Lachancea quebecensis]
MSTLEKLRNQLSQSRPVNLLTQGNEDTKDISAAKWALLGNTGDNSSSEKLDLDEDTDFQVDGKHIPLRVVLHCWQHKDSSAADYLADCQAKNLTNISFLQRQDILSWLSGKSQGLGGGTTGPSATGTAAGALPATTEGSAAADPVLQEALAHEKVLLDHNSSLRGAKPTNFGYLIKEAELKLVHSLKSSRRSQKSSGGVSKYENSQKAAAKKDPIILIPSAASSIFTTANIKQFLEDSVYVHPRDLPGPHPDVTTAVKKLDRFAKPVKFLIANNTRLFTKPEYWDRVVAVFTTGHAWQFNNYQWSNPSELFQRCKGYYFYFAGDVVPKHVEQWNVQRVELDKNKRFRDVEVLRYFWNTIERELVGRGYS